jgi:hypothetical protein
MNDYDELKASIAKTKAALAKAEKVRDKAKDAWRKSRGTEDSRALYDALQDAMSDVAFLDFQLFHLNQPAWPSN